MSNPISSNDPLAIEQLQAKIADLEAQQERDRAINAAWRSAGRPFAEYGVDTEKWTRFRELVGETCPDPAVLESAIRATMLSEHWHGVPVPPYKLSNRLATIKAARARIANIEHEAARRENPNPPIHGNGYSITEMVEDSRIWIEFEDKPEVQVRTMLKRRGFRWSLNRSAWVRMLSNNGRDQAEAAGADLKRMFPDE